MMSPRDTDHDTDEQGTASAPSASSPVRPARKKKRVGNHLKRLREDRLLSKAEFARKAGLSPLTVDRIERGKPCRMNTKRKIILALGLTIEEKDQVFDPSDPSDETVEEES